jgi:two-component system chemotaxis sensor kinase CheA
VERAAGRAVVQYRGQILPLMPLAEHLDSYGTDEANDPEQVIVFADGDRRIGLVVRQILDIVEDAVTMKRLSDRPGLIGSGVVGQKITDFLDLQSIIQSAEQGWFDKARSQKRQAKVLLTENSAFSRGLLRNTLEVAGYQVVEAATAGEALEKLNRQDVDVLVTALDLPDGSASQLLESVKNEPKLSALPMLALTSNSTAENEGYENPEGFDDYLAKFDRASMLRSLEKLSSALQQETKALAKVGQ